MAAGAHEDAETSTLTMIAIRTFCRLLGVLLSYGNYGSLLEWGQNYGDAIAPCNSASATKAIDSYHARPQLPGVCLFADGWHWQVVYNLRSG